MKYRVTVLLCGALPATVVAFPAAALALIAATELASLPFLAALLALWGISGALGAIGLWALVIRGSSSLGNCLLLLGVVAVLVVIVVSLLDDTRSFLLPRNIAGSIYLYCLLSSLIMGVAELARSSRQFGFRPRIRRSPERAS